MSDIIRQGSAMYLMGTMVNTNEELVKRLLQFKDTLKAMRDPWEDLYKECGAYLVPALSDWDMDRDERGQKLTKPIYNSRPVSNINTVCGGLQGYLTPQNGNWVLFETVDRRLMDSVGVRRYLEAAQEHIMGVLTRNGFYAALSEAYPQLVGPGTTTVMTAEDVERDMMQFTTMHPKQIYVHQNHMGRIDTWAVELWMTRSQMISEYGRHKFSEPFLQAAERNPFQDELVTVFIIPRHVRDTTKLDQQNKPWAMYHVFAKEQTLLREGGADESPLITARWSTNSDEVYGRGWGLDVLSDVLRLNQLTAAELLAAQLSVDPPVAYPSEMREELELVPGARIPYFNPAKIPQRIELAGSYPLGKDVIRQLEENIAEQLMVTFFLSLQQLQGQRTATEVLELQGEKAAILGTLVNRTYNELIIPMLARTWDSEARHNRLPKPPGILLQRDAQLRLNFIGPLAQIQKKFHSHQGVSQTLAVLMPLVELSQGQVLDIVNWDELGRHILREGLFPQRAVRDRDEVDELRRQKAQIAAQQNAMAQMEQIGKAGGGLAKMKEAGMLPQGGAPSQNG